MKFFVSTLLLFSFLNLGILFCYGYSQNRIIGGNPAPVNKYRNVFRIFSINRNSNETGLCTSTLISKRHLLTAAHCVTDKSRPPVRKDIIALDYSPENFTVSPKLEKVSSFVIHSGWTNSNGTLDDIAILELPVEIKDIEPVLLAKNYEEGVSDIGINVGYGDTDPDPLVSTHPNTLMQIEIPILPKPECIYSVYNLICAGTPTKRADHGDSGGPLFFNSSLDGKLYEVGVAHAIAPKYGTVGGPDLVVFTRISPYCAWIEKITRGEAKCVEIGKSQNPVAPAAIRTVPSQSISSSTFRRPSTVTPMNENVLNRSTNK